MSYLTWHGTKGQAGKTRNTARGSETSKRYWNVDDIFRKLIEIADAEPYVKSDMIVDWITKAKPSQDDMEQVSYSFML